MVVFVGRGAWVHAPSIPLFFLKPSPSKPMPPIPHPPNLKMKPITLKSETPFKEMIPRKKPKKSETVINT